MIEKEQVKAYLSRNNAAYWAAAVTYENLLYPSHIVRQGLLPTALGFKQRGAPRTTRQSILTWNVELPGCQRPDQLIRWLRSKGIEVHEGGHTFYIPPQPALPRILGPLVSFYPDGSGFKILKDFRHPKRAKYLHKHRYALGLLMRLIGSPQDQIVAANYMYARGIGPRLWDLACWRLPGIDCTVFVVEHINGAPPTWEQSTSFLRRLERLNTDSQLRVLIPGWQQNAEFEPPYCNGNLIYSDAHRSGLYVDFQNFGLTSYRAWAHEIASAGASSDVESSERAGWSLVQRLLRRRSFTFEHRVVLDVGCVSSATVSGALAAGAEWAIAWCNGGQRQRLEESLLSAGSTRFSVAETESARTNGLQEGIPLNLRSRLTGSVACWRVQNHEEAIATELLRMPWSVLVCLAKDEEHATDAIRRLETSTPDEFDVIARSVPDGFGSHVTVVCRRNA